MRTVLYYRVSTEDQTVQPQQQELRAYAQQRGWTVTAEYTDVVSGSKSSRESLDLMMLRVRQHHFDAVLVVKLDRLARSLSHFAQLVGEFDKHNVALVCPGQGIDTSKSNPAGRLQMHVLAAVAEFERSLIVERTKAGLAAAKSRGRKLGHASKRMVPEPQRGEIICKWLDNGGTQLRELATQLGGVSVSTAFRLAQAQRNIRMGKTVI
jgi:DNA invertase Pin-like site-specific DNA recombinase